MSNKILMDNTCFVAPTESAGSDLRPFTLHAFRIYTAYTKKG